MAQGSEKENIDLDDIDIQWEEYKERQRGKCEDGKEKSVLL